MELYTSIGVGAYFLIRWFFDGKAKRRHADHEVKIIDLRDRINKINELPESIDSRLKELEGNTFNRLADLQKRRAS